MKLSVVFTTFLDGNSNLSSLFVISLTCIKRGNLVEFIEQAAARNLFVNLRIGPYVCAEWYVPF